MASVKTHYDNLKVARDAPDLVIRAAYRSLSQKYHPDRNPGDAHAAQIMVLLNRSYQVLSDPALRRQHDAWIKRNEATSAPGFVRAASPAVTPAIERPSPFAALLFALLGIARAIGIRVAGLAIVFGAIFLIGFVIDQFGGKSSPPPGPKPYSAAPPAPAVPAYSRPIYAPNGQAWPSVPGYVSGYPQLATDGLSEVTVDNQQNSSDVFVKLVSIDGAQAFPVRQFFIPGHASFTLNHVSAGNYDIRYRDLDSGGLSRSQSFQVEQTPTSNGIQYSSITMTLYKVANGNLQTYPLAESEF